MLILGVTGSIGSGKSFFCDALKREKGVAVQSSDAEVHNLYANNKTLLAEIGEHFPTAIINEKIDRKKLGEIVFKDAEKKKLLESLVYPLLQKERDRFISDCIKRRIKIAVLEIPLLFENGLDSECDVVITIYCNPKIQARRVYERSGISPEKLAEILSHQLPVSEKIKYSDFNFNTGQSKAATARAAKKLYNLLVSI